MNIAVVFLVAVLAAVIGDNLGFVVGHFGGRPLAERFGRYVFLTPERLDRAENYFNTARREDRHRRPLHRRAAPDQRTPGRDRRHALAEIPGLQRAWAPCCGWAPGARWATSPARTSSRSTTCSSGTSGIVVGALVVVVAIVITRRVRARVREPRATGLVVCSRVTDELQPEIPAQYLLSPSAPEPRTLIDILYDTAARYPDAPATRRRRRCSSPTPS